MRDGPLGERRVGMSSQSSAASGLAHELVDVFRHVDEASAVELHLVRRDHARRHALLAVHEREDGALLEAAARVARDAVPDAEAQVLGLLITEVVRRRAGGEGGLIRVRVRVRVRSRVTVRGRVRVGVGLGWG